MPSDILTRRTLTRGCPGPGCRGSSSLNLFLAGLCDDEAAMRGTVGRPGGLAGSGRGGYDDDEYYYDDYDDEYYYDDYDDEYYYDDFD